MTSQKHRIGNRRGMALIAVMVMGVSMVTVSTGYLNVSTSSMQNAATRMREASMNNLAEAGLAATVNNVWRSFKASQRFASIDAELAAVSPSNPQRIQTGAFSGIGAYSAGIVGYAQPDSYNRHLTVRAVGWVDRNRNGQLDNDEPRRTVDQTVTFSLNRSGVFDYSYFVNNYGWMYGFDNEQLICNGDMRANGDFEFRYGTPVINGGVTAAENNKLIPAAAGTVNVAPRQWTNSYYDTRATNWSRQAYNSSNHGTYGSSTFSDWRDIVYQDTASMVGGRTFGAALSDRSGTRTFGGTTIDAVPSQELTLPDLNDLGYYQSMSQTYVDTKATYRDGTANPYYGQGAWIEVWNPSTNAYQRVSTNGVISGSIALVGYASKPIKIHGPITVTQDVVIRGYVQGQGVVYSGRNTHVVGDIIYKNAPDFRGASTTAVDNANEKKDILALAARGSVMMGNTRQFRSPYPLDYMRPPFTKPRYDDNGNLIPAFDALEVDAAGRQRYRSTYGPNDQSEIERLSINIDIDQNGSISADERGISRVDSILFTNFVGGGNLATDGLGFTLNGSIICKDEAMVLWSLPMRFNYDSRIRERELNASPLIDINLPRTPGLLKVVYQSRQYRWFDH